METATVLVKTNKYIRGKKQDKFSYFKIELPEDFHNISKSRLELYRREMQDLYKNILMEDYVMVKFDKIEDFFDQ